MSESEHVAQGEDEGRLSEPKPDRRSVSVVGLSIVSALNIACLAFVVFHYIDHGGTAPQSPPDLRTVASEPIGPMPRRPAVTPKNVVENQNTTPTIGVLGNIGFAPTSNRIISIASGIDDLSLTPSDPTLPELADKPNGSRGKSDNLRAANTDTSAWVQLGALSTKATATSYWAHLAEKHGAILDGQAPPQFVGPETVGGALFHIRLGPMDETKADQLCEQLQSDGADCFCIRSPT